MDSSEYDLFISYARKDNATGWVSGLFDAIYEDFRGFSSEPFKIFFDTKEIHSRQDWELRLREGLRSSRVLLMCLSPDYLKSPYCRWEWEEFARVQARRIAGGDPVTGVYFVDLGGDQQYESAVAAWRHEHAVERVQLENLQPWFPDGVKALQEAEVRARVKALGQGVHEALSQARLAKQAPGNLRRHNPLFVGRIKELHALREQLTGGAVGVVTALQGIGGMGKTELAARFAHVYAADYQGGTWQVDADGQTDMLEALSTLALFPDLGLRVKDADLNDRHWLGRRVLARLAELNEKARASDPLKAACLVLLDNVSEVELLSEDQLGVLPEESWLHLMATTRMGTNDIGVAGTRASVAMIEVGRLGVEDALELMREHQPARDAAHLYPDFASPAEEDAARRIVALLDGYTLAIEVAAVYLGVTGEQPTSLLADLQAHGAAVLDQATTEEPDTADRTTAAIRGQIRHQDKLAGQIIDQTLQKLPPRARNVLAFACLLPPDAIPWDWLRELTSAQAPSSTGLRGLSRGDGWAATLRVLEGRRLLTPADDARFARLHRVMQAHLRRTALVQPLTENRLDVALQQESEALATASPPDTKLLDVTAAAVTARLAEGSDGLARAASGLVDRVRERLNLASAENLVVAMLHSFERLVAAEPANTDLQHDLSASLNKVGEVRVARGDVAGAFNAHTRAVEIAEALVAAEPGNPVRQQGLSISLSAVGGLRAAHGDPAGALRDYTRSLDMAERLVAAQPGNTLYQRDLSDRLNNIGDIKAARGDPHGALNAYTRSLHILEGLAAADPQNSSYQRDMTVRLNNIGDLHARWADSVDALHAYGRSVHILEGLATADPDNTGYKRELAASLVRVGNVRNEHNDAAAALRPYASAVHILEDLVAADPDNIGYQHRLATTLNRVGDAQAVLKDRDDALRAHVRAVQILERLADADKENTEFQRNLASGLIRVGDAQTAIGDLASALDAYVHGLEVRGRVAAADRENNWCQRDVAVSVNKVAETLAARGDLEPALQNYTNSVRIFEALTTADPGNIEYLRGLGTTLDRVGDLLNALGDTAGAGRTYSRCVDSRLRAVTLDPSNDWLKRELADIVIKVGDLQAAQGLFGAFDTYGRALQIFEQLAAANTQDIRAQRDLAHGLNKMGDFAAANGNTAGALETYGHALQIFQGVIDTDPHLLRMIDPNADNAERQRDLADTLRRVGDMQVIHADHAGALHSRTRAVQIFEQLARAEPGEARCQRGLALALNALGDLQIVRGSPVEGLRAYTRSMLIVERLADAFPDDTAFQRDLWIGAYKLGASLEIVGDAQARVFWSKAHQVMATLDASGNLPDEDRPYLDEVNRKLGFTY